MSLVLLARYVRDPTWMRALAAGVGIGITTGFKYPGVFLAIPAVVAAIMASSERGWRRVVPIGPLLVMGAGTVVAFFVTSPYILLDFGRTRETANFLSPSHTAPLQARTDLS